MSLDPNLPTDIAELARTWAAQQAITVVEFGNADMGLGLAPSSGGRMVQERILVPVQRFSSLRETISVDDLRQAWTEPGTSLRLAMDPDTAADLTRLWGTPPGTVDLVRSEELVDHLWEDGGAVGIVPFEQLVPRLTPLSLDGLSAVDNRLDQEAWPLALRVWLRGSGGPAESLLAHLRASEAPTNRDPGKLTVLVMTGVTAMARMTALRMEQLGDYAYPGRVIGPELAAADITHISNEVPFVPGCEADPTLDNVILCSKPEYVAALEEVGADIVGLTGNHQNDFGPDAMLGSLEIYAQHDLKAYGAGSNDVEARRALTIEHHGNRLAFLGANEFGPPGAWATGFSPGSARFDLGIMSADIAAVRPEADVVLVELQYTEFNPQGEYQAEPLPKQKADFEALSAAGADIVTGVQAHRPQAVGFGPNGILLFGLGNLFFDQMNWPETRQGLIARHAIYDGRHIATELLTTMLEDWSQPRWATPEERLEILTTIFAASGW
jgi:poly-gamma-glutamate synthesis protein (capsule biosynthesis protein)